MSAYLPTAACMGLLVGIILAITLVFGITALRACAERKHTEGVLRTKELHAQSLLRLSKIFELAQTYNQVVEAAQNEVRAIIGYQSTWVYFFAEDKKYSQLLVVRGTISEAVLSEEGLVTLKIEGDSMLEEIAAAKDIVVVKDARTDPRTDKQIVAKLGNRTIINVPIFLFDRHLGSMGTGTFGDEGVRVPTRSEEEYLRALASHLAVTLDRIHLLNQRNKIEEGLQQALKDKDALIHELHHRVKNNLHVIISLLQLQARHVESSVIQNAFKESQSRIFSMALVHDNLYRSPQLNKIRFREYVENLVASLSATFRKPDVRISIEIDDISLDIDTAIPCGLIINELITNSFKHAFRERGSGIIGIKMRGSHSDEQVRPMYTLHLTDNGIGLPEGFEPDNSKTLGLKLVSMFVRQLQGASTFSGSVGTEFKMTFSPAVKRSMPAPFVSNHVTG